MLLVAQMTSLLVTCLLQFINKMILGSLVMSFIPAALLLVYLKVGAYTQMTGLEIFEWPSDNLLLKFALPFSIFNWFYFLIGLILFILFLWKKYGEQNAYRKRTLELLVTTGSFTGRRDEIL